MSDPTDTNPDPLATVPAEEREKIRTRARAEARRSVQIVGVSKGTRDRIYEDVIRREVAAYHAQQKAPWVKDARFPGCEIQRGEGPEVTAVRDAAAHRARAWDPVGGRPNEPTEGDILEGATMGAAAPLTEDELRDIETRTFDRRCPLCWLGYTRNGGHDVERHDEATDEQIRATFDRERQLTREGAAVEALLTVAQGLEIDTSTIRDATEASVGGAIAAEVRALRAERDAASAALTALGHPVQTTLTVAIKEAHEDTMRHLHALRRSRDLAVIAKEEAEDAVDRLRRALQDADIDPDDDDLSAAIRGAARLAPAADASLEARAEIAREAWFGGYPHSAKLADLPAEKQETWLAVVRAVDASRPALTEEQALRDTTERAIGLWLVYFAAQDKQHASGLAADAAIVRAKRREAQALDRVIGDAIYRVALARVRASRGEAPPSAAAQWICGSCKSLYEPGIYDCSFCGEGGSVGPANPPAAADPVPDRVGPRGSSYDGAHALRASALGSMAPAVIAEASRADVYAPAAALTRERWIDVGGIAHASNCSGQRDANGRCYCGAVQPLPGGLTCPGCYAETGIAQPHREPPRCPGYAAHVTARPEDNSTPTPGPAPACCSRAGEYNGFGSEGPRSFDCPTACGCHD